MASENTKAIATSETVSKACDELVARGQYPSQASIRTYLGGGSPNSIKKYQKEWREKADNDPTNYTVSFPVKPKEVEYAFEKLWAETYKIAKQLAISEQLQAIHVDNKQLRNIIAEKDEKLMDYEEMKGKVESQGETIALLIAKQGNTDNRISESQ